LAAAARLEELRRGAEEDLADVRLALGEHQAAVADLQAGAAAEPLRERRWAQLMLALYRCGRQADALRAYRRLRDLLGRELGIEPSRELAVLEEAILVQKPELSWRPPDDDRQIDAWSVACRAVTSRVAPQGGEP
jgi:DNA-binding SARP family transcriptional activator